MVEGNSSSSAERKEKKQVDFLADTLRKEIKSVAKKVLRLSEFLKSRPQSENEERRKLDGDVIAQSVLAYRHLEDASMRLGKVKQYMNDGESTYDKNVVGSK